MGLYSNTKRGYHDEVYITENIHQEIICEEEIKDDEVYGTHKIKRKVQTVTIRKSQRVTFLHQ